MSRIWSRPVVILVLCALVVATFLAARPPAPLPARAPAGVFSAHRAHADVRTLAREPHATGTAANQRVREQLVATLEGLGLRPRVHSGFGRFQRAGQPVTGVAYTHNVVATLPGTAPTGRVILAAHYDSAPASPGAADDAAGVAASLEIARTWQRSGARPRNDLVFLFTDAEEPGLYGSEAFVHQDQHEGGPTVVLNLEARGSGAGGALMFRTSGGNARLIDHFARTPHPVGDSSTGALFSLLPNDTDLTSFTGAGYAGLDAALVGGEAVYHSPLDGAGRLDLAGLQQLGANTTALSRSLGGADLRTLRTRSDAVYFQVPGLLLRYPVAWEPALALAALVLVAAWTVVARRRRLLTVPRLFAALAGGLVAVICSVAAGFGLWQLVTTVRPADAASAIGEPYWSGWILAAALALSVAVSSGWYAMARARLGPAAPAAGGTALCGLLGAGLAGTVPGISHLFALPALGAAAAGLVLMVSRRPLTRAVVTTAGLVPAAVLLGGAAAVGFQSGVGVGVPQITLSATLLAVLAVPLLAGLPATPATTGRRWIGLLTPAVAVGAAALLVAGHLMVTGYDARHPVQTTLSYAMDTDRRTATWIGPAAGLGAWAGGPAPGPARSVDDRLPWHGDRRVSIGEARPVSLPPPTATVLADRTAAGVRTLRLRLVSPRAAPVIGLYVDAGSATVLSARAGDRDVLLNRPAGRWDLRLQVYGAAATGTDVTLRLRPRRPGQQVRVRVADLSYDLRAVPGYRKPPSGTVNRYAELAVFRGYAL